MKISITGAISYNGAGLIESYRNDSKNEINI